MGWIGLAAALVVMFVTLAAVLLAKRPSNDLGAVSDQWIAQHRSQPR
jgi:hypothetical protein